MLAKKRKLIATAGWKEHRICQAKAKSLSHFPLFFMNIYWDWHILRTIWIDVLRFMFSYSDLGAHLAFTRTDVFTSSFCALVIWVAVAFVSQKAIRFNSLAGFGTYLIYGYDIVSIIWTTTLFCLYTHLQTQFSLISVQLALLSQE